VETLLASACGLILLYLLAAGSVYGGVSVWESLLVIVLWSVVYAWLMKRSLGREMRGAPEAALEVKEVTSVEAGESASDSGASWRSSDLSATPLPGALERPMQSAHARRD